jgi:DNA-binding NtrC family response regulator
MRRTVLLAIVHEPLRLQISDFLSDLDLEVVEAGTASEILDIVRRAGSQNHLLLTDVAVAAGRDPASTVTSATPNVRALVISGDPEYVNRELVPDERIDFIEKPFAWRELGEKIAYLLDAGTEVPELAAACGW